MSANNQIARFLNNKGISFIRFVDIRHLPDYQNRGYPSAILFGKGLSAPYLRQVAANADYVPQMIKSKTISQDEFHNTEVHTDKLADELADWLKQHGYNAFSQSEAELEKAGHYNTTVQCTPLPHKTLAIIAGLGWIGKNNLLITPEYGCALSMCSVLTDAPVFVATQELQKPQCGTCFNCQNICTVGALKGQSWSHSTKREQIIDIQQCTTCFQCVVQCPYTKAYYR